MADASDSKSDTGDSVGVQVPSPAFRLLETECLERARAFGPAHFKMKELD
jgi:hypothetical protein